jgi:hypothetical protein
LLQENKPKLDLTDLHAIKLTVGTKGAAAPDRPALQKLLKETKDAEPPSGGRLGQTGRSDLVGLQQRRGTAIGRKSVWWKQAMEACQAIDELNRALN